MLNRSLLLCFVMSLGGCVGHYQQPAPSTPHATLEAKWGDNNLIDGGAQGYWAFYDAHCQDTNQTGVLGAISPSSPDKNRFLIQPDRRIYLNALSSGIRQRESLMQVNVHTSCLNVSSFIPQTGVTYQVTHTALQSGCSLEIVEVQTGKPPSTLMIEPVTKECGL